jgi:hypothetical protein
MVRENTAMRKFILVVLLLTGFALAKDKNPADYPLTAHVVSVNTITTAHPSEETAPWTVQFRVGDLLYSCGIDCRKHVQVGTDVHARVEKNKLYILTDDGQTCDTHIRGVHEIPTQTK